MDPARIDRDIETAALTPPLEIDWEDYRHVSGRTALQELAEESPSALRDARMAWVTWLTATRISQPAVRGLFEARAREKTPVHLRREVEMTEPEIVRALVAAQSPGEARSLYEAWPEVAGRLAGDERRVRDVRREAFHRLGIDDVSQRLLGLPERDVTTAAERFLSSSRDLLRACVPDEPEWPLALDVRLARAATEGWPAHLTWRTAAELLPGLTLARNLPEPPRALGGASFARALATLGATFRRACEERSVPFVLREPPLFVDAHRTGQLFAALAQEPAFHARILGLMPGRAKDQAHILRVALFLGARTLALRVALASPGADVEALSALALGAPLPRGLRDVFPRVQEDDAAELVALLTMLGRYDALRAREGDDWFRNPKAFSTLRDMVQEPIKVDKLDPAPLVRRFEEQLG